MKALCLVPLCAGDLVLVLQGKKSHANRPGETPLLEGTEGSNGAQRERHPTLPAMARISFCRRRGLAAWSCADSSSCLLCWLHREAMADPQSLVECLIHLQKALVWTHSRWELLLGANLRPTLGQKSVRCWRCSVRRPRGLGMADWHDHITYAQKQEV